MPCFFIMQIYTSANTKGHGSTDFNWKLCCYWEKGLQSIVKAIVDVGPICSTWYKYILINNFLFWLMLIYFATSKQLNSYIIYRLKDFNHGLLINEIKFIWSYKALYAQGACKKHSLTHWDWDKMAAISLTTLSNAFSWMKMLELFLKYHWSLFLRDQLTILQYWFR